MVKIRRAEQRDLEPLLNLIELGFGSQTAIANPEVGREHRILFTYLYSKRSWDPNWVYLAEVSGEVVAAVGFFPQKLNFDGVAVPVWAVSPVVSHPEYRGHGYAGQCLQWAITDLARQGISVVFLWGLPAYYPRFGFVPVLPRYRSKINDEQLKNLDSGGDLHGSLRPVKPDDLKMLAKIYDQEITKYWLQAYRSFDWWRERYSEMGIKFAKIKEVPFPQKEKLLVWENKLGEVGGYLCFDENESKTAIIVSEANCLDSNIAEAMLRDFAASYLNPNQNLVVRGTPEHRFNTIVYRQGGLHINAAPRLGMFKVVDWANFLNSITPIFIKRLEKSGYSVERFYITYLNNKLNLELNNKIIIKDLYLNEIVLTKLVLGFYDSLDLTLLDVANPLLKELFPLKYPFIWDANYLY